jgi:hypothetical protein
MRLKVADIVFDVSCDIPMETLYLESPCSAFYSNENPDVFIHGHYSSLPDFTPKDQDKAFSSNIFWNVYRIDSRPVFILKTPSSVQPPHCIAVFDDKFRCGDVYYRMSYFADAGISLLPHPLAFPIFHLLMISLLSKGYGVLLHACGINDNGIGYLFTGSSSHGKTTMARLWEDEATVLNDERIVLRQNNGQLWMYGTPWHGEYDRISPDGVPLRKVFFLRHGTEDAVHQQKALSAAAMLLTHSFMPLWETDGMQFILDFCALISETVPCYELNFLPKKTVVDFIRCVK